MVTTIHKSQIDVNRDGKISKSEVEDYSKGKDKTKTYRIVGNDRVLYEGKLDALLNKNSEFSLAGDVHSPTSEIERQLRSLGDKLAGSVKDLETARAEKKIAEEARLQADIKKIVANAEKLNDRLPERRQLDLSDYRREAGTQLEKQHQVYKAATIKDTPMGQKVLHESKAMSLPQGSSGSQAFKATTVGTPPFDASTYAVAMTTEENIASAWDSINSNSKRGKELMRLFFYYAKMAESGDLGALYQFMKFISFIVTKDKAKQQIEMGNKLIQLQELSRQWTNKLLDLKTDSTDPSASNELMKMMTLVKGETDSIAMAQKIIAQMSEECIQVSETLANVVKNLLDADGRVNRRLSAGLS